MVKGKTITFKSKLQEELAIHLCYPISGAPPYYPDFQVLRDLIKEISDFISVKVKEIREEISREDDDTAGSMYSHYYPILNNYHDLAFKSVFLMVYFSFENTLGKTELLLSGEILRKKFDFKNFMNLLSCRQLVEQNTSHWQKAFNLNKIRNFIVHNDSEVPEKEENKDLIIKINTYKGILFEDGSRRLVITDVQFLYDSIDIFQAILDEIYQNSGVVVL